MDWSPGLLPYANEIALRIECLRFAQSLEPKDAGDLIRKAAGIYRWLTTRDTKDVTVDSGN